MFREAESKKLNNLGENKFLMPSSDLKQLSKKAVDNEKYSAAFNSAFICNFHRYLCYLYLSLIYNLHM